MSSIKKWFELREVVPYTDKYLATKNDKLEVIDSKQLIGIEVELEKYSDRVSSHLNSGVWNLHNDGSLRNNGVEFITSPMEARYAPRALNDLFEAGAKTCCFTPRTSVHVHFNCQELTDQQVLDVILLYMHFETRLYNFVGKNRIKNIYCVPINSTLLIARMINERFDKLVTKWKKYTGLNLLPLASKGTLEFRQMHGTTDVKKLCIWIRMLAKIFQYAEKAGTAQIRRDLLASLSDDDVIVLGKQVFGDDWHHLAVGNSSKDAVTAKQAWVTNSGKVDTTGFSESLFMTTVNKLFRGI